VRVAVLVVLALVTLVAMVAAPIGALVAADACCEAFLKQHRWLIAVLFLGSGIAVVAAGIAAGVFTDRAIGNALGDGYRRRFLGEVTGPLVSSAAPGAAVDVTRGLERAELEQSELFPGHLVYDTAFRVEGREGSVGWTAGDVKAWRDVASGPGSSSARARLTWLHGLYGWLDLPCPVPTPVLVACGSFIRTGVGMARRMDLLRGETGDPAFDALFQVLASDREPAVPALPAELRRALIDLRQRFGPDAYFSVTPAGVAIAVPVYGRMMQDSRRLLEPRLLAANDAGELRREADLIAQVPVAAARIAQAVGRS
jgi:hypothetical protein